MITTVKVNGKNYVAIALEFFGEADMPDFANSMLNVLQLAFTSDDAKDFVETTTLYHVLELYKSIIEGKEVTLC